MHCWIFRGMLFLRLRRQLKERKKAHYGATPSRKIVQKFQRDHIWLDTSVNMLNKQETGRLLQFTSERDDKDADYGYGSENECRLFQHRHIGKKI